jgi:glycosyltransferase involved in cell wall biosynthesis
MRQTGPGTRTRILYLIDNAMSTGGAERFAVGLATHLPQDRFEPWVCSTRRADLGAEATLSAAGVPHISLGRVAKWDVYKFAGLVRILRRERFDVLHSHMFGSNLWGTTIGTACRVPVLVAQEHSWSFEGNPLRAWVDGHVIGRLADRFIAVSRADGERMVAREGVRVDKVEVIGNGYIPSSSSSDTDVRAELGIDRGAPVIAIAAVLRPEKRLELLLEAHAEVVRALPAAQLVLAGDGPCRRELEDRAHDLGLDGHVHFLGFRSDVDSVLRAANVGALSSDREGSPLLMFECMANGTPFVATAVGGVCDVIQDGRNGVLVPRRDPGAMARALIGILTDPDRARRLAAAARAEVDRFTIDATAKRFATLYDTLLKAQR